jgi:hypothetical protein
MYYMLRQHPNIFMPTLKEPNFLAPDLAPVPFENSPWLRSSPNSKYLRSLPSSLDRYLELFSQARDDQRIGEASALYLISESAAESIATLNPSARVILVFREPISFMYSYFLLNRRTQQENIRTFAQAIAFESEREHDVHRRSYRPQELSYFKNTNYTEQLERYVDVLPPEQILTLIYDDYLRDNEGTVRRVFEFLHVDRNVPVVPVVQNRSVVVRSRFLDEVIGRFTGSPNFNRSTVTSADGYSAIRRLLKDARLGLLYSPPPSLDPDLIIELRRLLKPEVEHFSEYLGRDLVQEWGYRNV